MNKILVTGRLTSDPEMRAKFDVATATHLLRARRALHTAENFSYPPGE